VRGLRAAAAVAVAATVLTACADGPGGGADPTPSGEVRTLAAPEPADKKRTGALPARVPDIADGRLAAGTRYRTRRLPDQLTVTVPQQFFGVDANGFFGLATDPSDPSNRPGIVFSPASALVTFEDGLIDNEAFQANFAKYLRPMPKDLDAWITNYPRLQVAHARKVTLAGREARVFDYRVADLPERGGYCRDPACLLLFAVPAIENLHTLPDRGQGRIVLLPTGDDTLVIVAGAPREEWGRFEAVVEQILQSLELD
jgi:hypothetical protein